MTPKEKARELIEKYLKLDEIGGQYDGYLSINLNDAKDSVLIAVNEILQGYEFDSLDIEHKRMMDNINFWDEVKTEIEKL